ncbi:ribosomal protein S2, flavodoxin-like domain-containing protein [Phakopsora pachyrhizi]|uniref:Ribosomal protein S2, flavodoxin-like domain-containing protein n=1 Tax=Phakopsora pachyrhizi TaxID=170000 RepID=A0AAV0AMJ5_PHAPC|nr:ribosomal protein S2, flavodoxin-like domain-containing protein [Phakopsora pachyrhizi]CAH7669477.1 ribosomal protein S2, flavodoxin-like domain-containing protein [Phakopsora pachyrhizi]
MAMEVMKNCIARKLIPLKRFNPRPSASVLTKPYSTAGSVPPVERTIFPSDDQLQPLDSSSSLPNHVVNSSGGSGDIARKNERLEALIERMRTETKRTILYRQRLAADRTRLSKLGSVQTTLRSAQPSFFRANPPSDSEVTLAALITATSHLGHNKSLTCPANYPFIYGIRSDISIIDLRQTLIYLRRACNVLRETVQNDGIILFANGVDGTQKAIKLASERLKSNGYCLGQRTKNRNSVWVRGTLTNAPEVLKGPRQSAKNLRLATNSTEDSQSHYSRRNQSENLEAAKFLPSLIVLFNPKASKVLIREAALKQIPTIGVIDTDVDPRVVTYPIPANDDSVRSIELIAGILSKAGQEGLMRRTQRLSQLISGSDVGDTMSEFPL